MLDENTLATLEANYRATRPAQPKPQPKKDNRKSWLSVLPSIAAAGASFIPGVGTLGAAALGGLGELGRQALSGEGINLGNVGKEAALSAVPGGAGRIVKGIRGGIKTTKTTKVAKAADEAVAPAQIAKTSSGAPIKDVTTVRRGNATVTTPAAGEELPAKQGMLSRVKSRMTASTEETATAAAGARIRGAGRNIRAGEKIPGTQDVLDQPTADRINAIVNKNNTGLISRTPRGQLRAVQEGKKAKGAELDELTTRFDNKLDDKAYGTIGKSLETERGKIVGFDPTSKEHIQLNNNYAARIGNAKTVKELEQQRKYFDKEAKRILTNPDNKGTLSANLAKAYRDAIDDYVSKVNPALKAAKGEYRDLSMAEDLLSRPGTLKPQQNTGFGRIPTLPVKVAQEGAGKVLETVGSSKPGARFARGLTGQVATRLAAAPFTANPEDVGATPLDEETPLEGEVLPPGTITPEASGGSLAGLDSDTTMKALQAASLQALARGDTQGIAAIKTVMDIVGAGKKAEKPLSAEAAKVVSNAQAGLEAIDDFEALIAEDPGAFARTGIPGTGTLDNLTGGRVGGALGTDVIDAAGDQIIDVIARLRTGAAISQQEETRFKRYIPRPGDSEKARAQKLGYLRRQFQRVADRSGSAGTDTQQLITEGAAT